MPKKIALINAAFVLVGCAWIAITWYLYFQCNTLKLRLQAMQQATQKPYVINGFIPDIIAQTVTIKESSPQNNDSINPNRLTLVLISQDTCMFCESCVSVWGQLLKTAKWQKGDEVWLISHGNNRLIEPLILWLSVSNTVRYRVMQIADSQVFALRTGMSAVPVSCILDASGAVRVILDVAMAKPELAVFAQVLNRHEEWSLGINPFLHGSTMAARCRAMIQ